MPSAPQILSSFSPWSSDIEVHQFDQIRVTNSLLILRLSTQLDNSTKSEHHHHTTISSPPNLTKPHQAQKSLH